MNKKVIKSTFFVAILILFVLIMLPMASFGASYGEENEANNYIAAIRKSYVDGRFELGLEVDIEYDKLGLEEDEVAIFKENLSSTFGEFLKYEKDYITEKYNKSLEKTYSPDEDVVFGEIEKGEEYLYFGIMFSSLDAYKFFYSDLTTALNEGFLISSLVVNIDFPFNDEISTALTRKEYYLQSIYSAAEGLSIEESIKENFKPKFLFDFISAQSRYKSNCDGWIIDNEDYYHYMWGLKREPADMKLQLNYANTGWWYLLGITIPLAVMAVCIAVILINEKLKKKNEK